MKIILDYEVVYDKEAKKILGNRPNYGSGNFLICYARLGCEWLSNFFMELGIKIQSKFLTHTIGEIEEM